MEPWSCRWQPDPRVEVVNSAGFPPLSVPPPMLGNGSRQARSALAMVALLLVACIVVDVYLLLGLKLGASQLVLALVIEGALLMAAIALFWTWLETRILHPLRVLEDDIDLIV
ncbi:MAG TPA: hypothetical protein VIS76_04770, partial [Pseudomonadales bacterium]